MDLNKLAAEIHNGNVKRGFWDNPPEIGTLLMLCTSELAEALEADRKGRKANLVQYTKRMDGDEPEHCKEGFKRAFTENIKDTLEDELADTLIRILDMSAGLGVDIQKHVELKLKYNNTRERLHGKKY